VNAQIPPTIAAILVFKQHMNRQQKQMAIAGAVLAGAGLGLLAVGLNSCVSIPKGAKAVAPFDLDRYLGKWYEIARMDYRFERNLSKVTAIYAKKDEKSIWVVNRGYDDKRKKWKQSIGRAVSVVPDTGRLKVSFFGPFFAGYNVIAIDPHYQYALVVGNNLDYLWLLSRDKTMPDKMMHRYLNIAERIGYDITKLIWTRQ
jgi:apolipoprotein D and lipocalin family protein